MSAKRAMQRVGPCLFRKADGGKIYARVRDRGRLTWKSTETGKAGDARKWLRKWRREKWMLANGIEPEGVTLQRARLSVAAVIDTYLAAGCPTRRGKTTKRPQTVRDENRYLRPVRQFFGDRPAAGLCLGDCDAFHTWRRSGKWVVTYKLRGHPRTLKTKGGNVIVDHELQALSNALGLAVRRGLVKTNPVAGRGRYQSAEDVRHCREVAPTPEGLVKIVAHLRDRKETAVADLVQFLAYSGLRIGEALPLTWEAVDLGEGLLQVAREKRGVNPWVPILPEMEALLREMQNRAKAALLFPSPFNPERPRDHAAIRHRLTSACAKLGLGHVTPHGLRSYFVTQARQSGLTDAEIAALIGDKSGPALIASTYGDLRDDHLLAQAKRIRLTMTAGEAASSHQSSHTLPQAGAVRPLTSPHAVAA